MKLVISGSEVFRLTDWNYVRVLQVIAAGHSLSNDNLKMMGRSLGSLASNLDQITAKEAQSKLENRGYGSSYGSGYGYNH